VYLFAKSKFVIGQFTPAFIILFLSTWLCFLNSSHSRTIWSVVCGLILQRNVGSSVVLNLWKYDLTLPCLVTIVDKFIHTCSLFDSLSFTLGKNVFVIHPSLRRPIQFATLAHLFILIRSSLHFSEFWYKRFQYRYRKLLPSPDDQLARSHSCRRVCVCVCVCVRACVRACVCVRSYLRKFCSIFTKLGMRVMPF
jgi:hypothetical protein